MLPLPYADRTAYCKNPTAIALLSIIEAKQTNLCVSADVFYKEELLQLADDIGPQICVLKTHIDTLEDFDKDFINQLTQLAAQHHFLIFEDRKFADIGNTVKNQYAKGIYHIADWAQITNAHALPGPGIVEGLQEIGLPRGNGLLLIAEMSSSGQLMPESYQRQTLDLALAYPEFVFGFITQHRLTTDPGLIHFTPGVNIAASGDALGQQYISPATAISERGSDVIIVGRGIYQAKDVRSTAELYRQTAWEAYQFYLSQRHG